MSTLQRLLQVKVFEIETIRKASGQGEVPMAVIYFTSTSPRRRSSFPYQADVENACR